MTNVVTVARRLGQQQAVQAAFAFMGQGAQGQSAFPMSEIDSDSLLGAVVRWCGQGHAISFGLSGDGGAFGVHLIAGGEKRSRWFGHVAELEDFLATVPGPTKPERRVVQAPAE